jgi:hypothetical protein
VSRKRIEEMRIEEMRIDGEERKGTMGRSW